MTVDGVGLVSHAGAGLLSEVADRSGLTEAMSHAMGDCGISWHTHDPGVVLTHLAVAIADGADCLSDLAVLREQAELFGPVASQATAWRAIEAVTAPELRGIAAATATARARVWAAAPGGLTDVLAVALDQLPDTVVTSLFSSMLRNVDVDAVDVPGLTHDAFVGGARIERLWAFAPPTGAALSVTLLSHLDTACVGSVCDRAAVGDPALLHTCMERALDEVLGVTATAPTATEELGA